jgi:hypothetical protein
VGYVQQAIQEIPDNKFLEKARLQHIERLLQHDRFETNHAKGKPRAAGGTPLGEPRAYWALVGPLGSRVATSQHLPD